MSHSFIAPTGSRIVGAIVSHRTSLPIVFTKDAPGSAIQPQDWDLNGASDVLGEVVRVDGDELFKCADGLEWMGRHLIPSYYGNNAMALAGYAHSALGFYRAVEHLKAASALIPNPALKIDAEKRLIDVWTNQARLNDRMFRQHLVWIGAKEAR